MAGRFARLLLMAGALMAAAPAPYPDVKPGVPLRFPADHGAHPDYRTEWWYVTGWVKGADGRERGFQVTFFRSRLPVDPRNPSAFAPGQILFAHAGLSDPVTGRLLHDQRSARAGFGLAGASTRDADVTLRDWRFKRLQTAASRPASAPAISRWRSTSRRPSRCCRRGSAAIAARAPIPPRRAATIRCRSSP
jgi:predicted secreted hydrolase